MGEREFDMELLIKEIHSRPILWDRRNQYYANKDLKNKAWQDLCAVFDEAYSTSTAWKQMEICQTVRRKFKSLRDSYQRERNLQRFEDSTNKNSKRKKYMYFDQLYFLSSGATKNKEFTKKHPRYHRMKKKLNQQVEKDLEKTTIPTNTPKQVMTTELITNEAMNMTTQNPSTIAPSHSGLLPPSFSYSEPKNNEEDTLFLLSLVKEIKKIPEDSRLTAKIDILQTIKRWQTSSESQHNGAPTDRYVSEHNSTKDCPICKITFKAKSDQRNHMVKTHIKNGLYVCNVCSAHYITVAEIALHMKLHKPEHPVISETSDVIIVKDESMDANFDESPETNIKLELSTSEDSHDE